MFETPVRSHGQIDRIVVRSKVARGQNGWRQHCKKHVIITLSAHVVLSHVLCVAK